MTVCPLQNHCRYKLRKVIRLAVCIYLATSCILCHSFICLYPCKVSFTFMCLLKSKHMYLSCVLYRIPTPILLSLKNHNQHQQNLHTQSLLLSTYPHLIRIHQINHNWNFRLARTLHLWWKNLQIQDNLWHNSFDLSALRLEIKPYYIIVSLFGASTVMVNSLRSP